MEGRELVVLVEHTAQFDEPEATASNISLLAYLPQATRFWGLLTSCKETLLKPRLRLASECLH